MNASLTDRYVYAAARSVPEAQRTDLERELRERIGDATDALVETGRAPADAERMARQNVATRASGCRGQATGVSSSSTKRMSYTAMRWGTPSKTAARASDAR